MILKVNIRVLTLLFLTKDTFHNDYALVFFIYLKTIKRVSQGLLQNTKAAKFPRKIARDQLRLGPMLGPATIDLDLSVPVYAWDARGIGHADGLDWAPN